MAAQPPTTPRAGGPYTEVMAATAQGLICDIQAQYPEMLEVIVDKLSQMIERAAAAGAITDGDLD